MKKRAILIGIAGGTGSGKTTVAKAITNFFEPDDVALIEQDCYYHDLSHMCPEERAQVNFDHPNSFDFETLKLDIKALLKGEEVHVPEYDYKTHTRSRTSQSFLGQPIIVLEGILALYDTDLNDLMDIKIFVDTADDIRIIRRLKRDIHERGRDFDSVVQQYYTTVRPMHMQFIEPSKRNADIVVPEGGQNKVAIDLLQTKIQTILERKQSFLEEVSA